MVWLNPERERYWGHETISTIGRVVPMFPLTLDGLRDGVDSLRRRRAVVPVSMAGGGRH